MTKQKSLDRVARLAIKVSEELAAFEHVLVIATTGTAYITFACSKINKIRIANHGGHQMKANQWELRTDACTKRCGARRIYNAKALSSLIADFSNI